MQGAVLVVGATGHQGDAAVRHLRRHGLAVRVLEEDEPGPAIGRARRRGVTPVRASVNDREGLDFALAGVDSLVMVLDRADVTPEQRMARGRALAEAARRAGVGHVVYLAGTAYDHHVISFDQSKVIEHHLRGTGLDVTVLRPATIMEEIPWYWLSRFGGAIELAAPFAAYERLPMISAADVGALAALAVASPEHFRGRTIRVAGDVMSLGEVAEVLSEELREPVRYTEVQVEGVFIYADVGERPDDLLRLRSVHPRLHTVRTWLEAGGGLDLCRRAVARRAA